MIAKYNGRYYYYILNKHVSNIITEQKSKAGDDFIYEDGVYYKKIEFESLEEVFDIKYIVFYDSKISGVSLEWEISNNYKETDGDSVLIRFSNGILPGWSVEENNVCIKYVSANDIIGAKEVRIYRRKNRQTLDKPTTEEKLIDKRDLIAIRASFCRENL